MTLNIQSIYLSYNLFLHYKSLKTEFLIFNKLSVRVIALRSKNPDIYTESNNRLLFPITKIP